MDQRKTTSTIASSSEINRLFRSKISEIAYAWNIVRSLGDVELMFLKQGNVTLDQVEAIANNLSQILSDSSRLPEVQGLINTYLATGDLGNFLQISAALADAVNQKSTMIDLKTPATKAAELFQQGIKNIDLPSLRIVIERSIRSEGENGTVTKIIEAEISIKSQVLGIWKQETSKLSHDFRVIERNSPEIFQAACDDYQARLQKLCELLKDVLSLRMNYEGNLKSFFRGPGKMSVKKQKILNGIERKVAELIDQKSTLDVVELYQALRPDLKAAVDAIEKPGRLKKMLHHLIEKHDVISMPAATRENTQKLELK